MSVTVHSVIVDPDVLIPKGEYVKGFDLERLTPWVFEHTHIADSDCTEFWPHERGDFRDFFWLLNTYYAELNEGSEKDIIHALKVSETIMLPKKNWKVSRREYFANFMRSQGMLLRVLVETIYYNLKDYILQTPRLYFPVSRFKQTYVIGGERYAATPDGAAMIDPQEQRLPIISFVGWYEGQTWNEFLAEILSIMLGQLAKNYNADSQDQEVFIIGFYGRCIYIARGYFTSDLISQAHLKGCKDETIEIQFTRGYNLSLKKDWLEAITTLARLLQYLLSGNAKISALKTYLHMSASSNACI